MQHCLQATKTTTSSAKQRPPGNDFIGEGNAGTSLPCEWRQSNIIIPLNIYLYYCILTEYCHQSQHKKTRGNDWCNVLCNHPLALSCTNKRTFLGTQATRNTSLVRLQAGDGISTYTTETQRLCQYRRRTCLSGTVNWFCQETERCWH